MRFSNIFRSFCVASVLISQVAAQPPATRAPRQEKLLNGLRILMWPDRSESKVTARLRIHSGSAFDPQGKEGATALVAESFFPTKELRDFFTDDLGGSVAVAANYDYIQITATSTPEKLIDLLDAIASAVSTASFEKETFAQLRAAALRRVEESEKDPAYLAERAAATRLFGTFPYGRPVIGTRESLTKVELNDLLELRQRFVTSDNSTLAITGDIDPALTYRAVRRQFGSWLKSDRLPPSTFRQPEAPKAGMPVFDSPEAASEFRYAIRGYSRGDKESAAAAMLALILDRRMKRAEGESSFVRHEAMTLPGAFVFGASRWNIAGIKRENGKITVPSVDGYAGRVLSQPITTDEFDSAKREFVAARERVPAAEQWLDMHTYNLPAITAQEAAVQAVTRADAQQILDRLQKSAAAYVLVFGETAVKAPVPDKD